MKRLVREPVFQFLVIGLALVAAHSLFPPPEKAAKERIVVGEAVIDSLGASFEATWNRAPSEEERQGLIRDYIAEEVLYREAQKLGLDENDVVIRRRMRQKMEFLLQESLSRPDELALRSYYEARKLHYAQSGRFAFEQVYLGEENPLEREADLRRALESLDSGSPEAIDSLARPSLLPETVPLSDAETIERLFGGGFAKELDRLPTGSWGGPVRSAYGWHLVRLERASVGRVPPLETLRDQVESDFLYEKRKKAEVDLIERLSKNYEIIVGEPET